MVLNLAAADSLLSADLHADITQSADLHADITQTTSAITTNLAYNYNYNQYNYNQLGLIDGSTSISSTIRPRDKGDLIEKGRELLHGPQMIRH